MLLNVKKFITKNYLCGTNVLGQNDIYVFLYLQHSILIFKLAVTLIETTCSIENETKLIKLGFTQICSVSFVFIYVKLTNH